MSLRGASRGNPGESEFGDCETAADYFINLDSHGGLSPPRNDNGVLTRCSPRLRISSLNQTSSRRIHGRVWLVLRLA